MEKLENDGKLRRFSLFWLWKSIVLTVCNMMAISRRHHNLRKDITAPVLLRDRDLTRWWFQIFFRFTPHLEKIPILTNIFQKGSNHQLDNRF